MGTWAHKYTKLCTVSSLVIISITRYRDIDRGIMERTISWRPYIVRYRARTHVSRVRCSHTAAAASGGLRLIDVACRAHRPWLFLSHIPCGRPIMQRIGSLGWGLGDGSCISGGLNCVQKGPLWSSYPAVKSRNDVNTAAPVQCPLTLTPALALHTLVGNLFPVSTNDRSRG